MHDDNIIGLDKIIENYRRTKQLILTRDVRFSDEAKGEVEIPTLKDAIDNNKKAPSSTSIAIAPHDATDREMAQLADVLLLNSFVEAAAMRYIYQRNPKGWDITKRDEASDFIRTAANAKHLIMTKGLGGYVNLTLAGDYALNKEILAADIHFEFLNEIFKSFALPEDALAELDSLLTNVRKSLEHLQLKFSDESQPLDHLIAVFYFDKAAKGLDVRVPFMRLFFLHVEQSSWKLAIGKSSIDKFAFKMNHTDLHFLVNCKLVEDDRDEIEGVLKKLLNMSMDDINKALTPSLVKA